MKNLETLKAEYIANLAIVNKKLDDWNPATKNSMIGRQNRAKQDLLVLKGQIAQSALANSTIVLQDRVLGLAGVDEALTHAGSDPSFMMLDFLQPERHILSEMYPKGQKSFSINGQSIGRLNSLLLEVKAKIGARHMPTVTANAKYYRVYDTVDGAVLALEKILEDTYSTELKPLLFKAIIQDKLVNNLSVDKLTVVIYNVPSNFNKALAMSDNVVIINGNDA